MTNPNRSQLTIIDYHPVTTDTTLPYTHEIKKHQW